MLDRFHEIVAADPGAPALIDGDRVVTRAELAEGGRTVASQLRSSGLSRGDILAVRLPNSLEFVTAFLASLELELVFSPIDRDAKPAEIAGITELFGVRALLTKSGLESQSRSRSSELPADARLMKLTSGSTGAPKAIVCSSANLISDCRNICTTMQIAPGDINIGAIPFSHSYGFSNLVTPLLLQGTPIVISNEYLPLSILALCNRHRCTVAPLIPMVYDHLSGLPPEDGRFDTVRTFISAGAPLQTSTSRRFRERFGTEVHSFYGTSETGGITYDRNGAAVERGTVGPPLDGVSLDIDAASGRLSIGGPSVAIGTLGPEGFTVMTGRFLADDLGEIRPDGEVALTGRASDLINTAGKKVNPREVESVIREIAGITDVRVYGEDAGARGDVVAAVVVGTGITRDEIRSACSARLSSHKVPRIIKIVDRIPVDDRGKVKRSELSRLR